VTGRPMRDFCLITTYVELAKLGVRPLRDIFEIDFKGTPVTDEVTEVHEAEVLQLNREKE
jgi:hypothetical protein